MKNILNTNELLSLDNSLTPVPKRTLTYMITFIVGISLIFFGTYTETSEYLSYIISVSGLIISIIALGLIFAQPQKIINRHLKKTLQKHKLYFHSNEANAIIQNLEQGNIEDLFKRSCDNGPILTIIFSAPDKSYYIAQVFRFIPYEYIPTSDPIIYHKKQTMSC